MPPLETIAGLADFERDLDEFLEPRTINEHFVERYGDRVIEMVINQAHAGIGPGDQKYPPYSDDYAKLKKLTQGGSLGNWLRGVSRTGNVGGMLDKKNFSWRITRTGLWLVWTAPDARTGIVAEVHNKGLPIGRGGPRKRREFMHFDTRATRAVVEQGYERSLDELAADFSSKWGG